MNENRDRESNKITKLKMLSFDPNDTNFINSTLNDLNAPIIIHALKSEHRKLIYDYCEKHEPKIWFQSFIDMSQPVIYFPIYKCYAEDCNKTFIKPKVWDHIIQCEQLCLKIGDSCSHQYCSGPSCPKCDHTYDCDELEICATKYKKNMILVSPYRIKGWLLKLAGIESGKFRMGGSH